MKKLKENKGITLIALIITIIVLIILAVVAINAVQGDGIIAHAKNASDDYQIAQEEENTVLNNYLTQINELTNEKKGEDTFIGKYYKVDNEEYPYFMVFTEERILAYGTENEADYEIGNNGKFISCLLWRGDDYENQGRINKSDEKFINTCENKDIDISKVANNVIIEECDDSGYYSYIFFNLDYTKAYNIRTNSEGINETYTAVEDDEVLANAIKNAVYEESES